ncbi:hypothetical protein [Natronospira bacteriovora]|uniref:HTH merR-type domain-containing protein n=1 Tax=Natronospira bacteriovora TaxID=3069753 RepID=A0ABU0W8N7_9GAMM|nr:hypothetical protein [Natronospira sp. AB-CW4]MDQ2069820.1 hypothetical protein [Natronospira sp. AB-CW4]
MSDPALLRPQEAQAFSGVTRAQLRYWRRFLMPLQKKSGNNPSFTLGDVLALRVVRRAISECGCEVRYLATAGQALFAKLNGPNWPRLAHFRLYIFPASGDVLLERANESTCHDFDKPAIVIDLREDVVRLIDIRLGTQSDELDSLPGGIEEKQKFEKDGKQPKAGY